MNDHATFRLEAIGFATELASLDHRPDADYVVADAGAFLAFLGKEDKTSTHAARKQALTTAIGLARIARNGSCDDAVATAETILAFLTGAPPREYRSL